MLSELSMINALLPLRETVLQKHGDSLLASPGAAALLIRVLGLLHANMVLYFLLTFWEIS